MLLLRIFDAMEQRENPLEGRDAVPFLPSRYVHLNDWKAVSKQSSTFSHIRLEGGRFQWHAANGSSKSLSSTQYEILRAAFMQGNQNTFPAGRYTELALVVPAEMGRAFIAHLEACRGDAVAIGAQQIARAKYPQALLVLQRGRAGNLPEMPV